MSKTEISIDQLSATVESALSALGLDSDERQAVANVLFYAELRGRSQGLIKIVERTVLPAADKSELLIVDNNLCMASISANGNIGMLVMSEAADKAASLCEKSGMALVSTCGTASSTGSIGYYAEKIAARGFIGIVLAGSPKVMALHGSSQAAMGTNPIAAALPTLAAPLVIDLATSAITWFDIIDRHRNRGQLPDDVAYDARGTNTRSPAAALQGALKTFGGVKGSALALLFECLTGPLSGASLLGDDKDSRGNLLLAIDPSAVHPEIDFRAQMSTMLKRMRETGASLPGDRSGKQLQASLAAGTIAIDTDILQELKAIAADV